MSGHIRPKPSVERNTVDWEIVHRDLQGGCVARTVQIRGTRIGAQPELILRRASARRPLEGSAGAGQLAAGKRSIERGRSVCVVDVVGVLIHAVNVRPETGIDRNTVDRQAGYGNRGG